MENASKVSYKKITVSFVMTIDDLDELAESVDISRKELIEKFPDFMKKRWGWQISAIPDFKDFEINFSFGIDEHSSSGNSDVIVNSGHWKSNFELKNLAISCLDSAELLFDKFCSENV